MNFLNLREAFAIFSYKLQIFYERQQLSMDWMWPNWKWILNAGIIYISNQFVHKFYTRHLPIYILIILWRYIYYKVSLKWWQVYVFWYCLNLMIFWICYWKKCFWKKRNEWKYKWHKWSRVCFLWKHPNNVKNCI